MNKLIERINFGKIKERYPLPHFSEYQLNSYEDFMQLLKRPEERENKGLEAIFRQFFPIVSSYGDLKLDYLRYNIEENGFPMNSEVDSKRRGKTYSISLKINLRLSDKRTGKVQESSVYFCDIPLMTEKATFVVNGAERVVVSQLHRSPGIFFSKETNMNTGKDIYIGKIVPYRGTWMEIEVDKDDVLVVKIDRKKKVPIVLFLKALGFFKNNIDILDAFFAKETKEIVKNKKIIKEALDQLNGSFIADTIINEVTGEVVLEAGSYIDNEAIEAISKSGVATVNYWKTTLEKKIITNSIIDDNSNKDIEPAMEVARKIRPGDIMTLEGAKNFIKQIFFEDQRYDLSYVGRYKVNQKLGLSFPEEQVTLTKDDIIATINYIINLYSGIGNLDDIDSLSNRRVRGMSELFGSQVRTGLAKMERAIKDKMAASDPETVTPQSLINTKFLQSVINDFFASGQLSQFMDQSNPLAELTHKRRISALGPGGLSRDRVSFEVRDVHNSHYGRICPIETPEGPNIGLIGSLASYARINKYGMIETPYMRVKNGKVLFDEIDYLTVDKEEGLFIAQVGIPVADNGDILIDEVICKYGEKEEMIYVEKKKVDYIDISPKQLVSVSAALIPFLEHDDATRASMGSNMQRQAVPLITPEAAYIGTGIEGKVALDSGAVLLSGVDGVIKEVDASKVIVKTKAGNEVQYNLLNFIRSNHAMSLTQKPLVDVGDKVVKGDVLADGPSTANGELALGKNVLVALMPWEGYNFEDAILISERLVKDDIFTSIHIEEYEVESRTTKLGDEEITKDIPNVGEDALKNLNENGIIKIGSEIKSGDILVGKITPKGETEPPAEEKLLRAIFGQRARDVRDTSLRLPHGSKGVVVDILDLSRDRGDEMPAGVNKIIRVYVAERRKITVGDKICGRHGNKGVVSRILPVEDMPYLADGTPIDVLLNPIGVPARMNIGQVLEAHLGFAAQKLNLYMASPVFDGAKENEIKDYLSKAGLPLDGQVTLYDGRTGEAFFSNVTVGYMYMLKLHHLVEDKMHARAIGPYSLVTQQPLGGKAQFGGQRLGEMEVWALEAYGASSILREMLTIKSDDILGRTKAYESIVKGEVMPEPDFPESFKVLIREFNSLGLDVGLYTDEDKLVNIVDDEEVSEGFQEFSLSYFNKDTQF